MKKGAPTNFNDFTVTEYSVRPILMISLKFLNCNTQLQS